jgi:hypothetical protein
VLVELTVIIVAVMTAEKSVVMLAKKKVEM